MKGAVVWDYGSYYGTVLPGGMVVFLFTRPAGDC